MPYYPKSQIKTNLYTNGDEFKRVDTLEEYKGYYWKNSKEEYYTGKNPQVTPSVRLRIADEGSSDESPNLPKKFSFWTDSYPNEIVSEKPGKSPDKFYPKPTEDDYTLGQIERYFTKKTNQKIYYEISKTDFDNLNSKSNQIQWQLYIPIKLSWQITGDKEEVYKANRNVVRITELTQKLPGFSKIFRKEYLQFYKESLYYSK